mmetsp:Transcript_32046/g.74695  ORF Transcript_32046/g.74695 Transcript_32046/m.74695 type:complete len:276 (+) Transcript_32046:369-1196(+)
MTKRITHNCAVIPAQRASSQMYSEMCRSAFSVLPNPRFVSQKKAFVRRASSSVQRTGVRKRGRGCFWQRSRIKRRERQQGGRAAATRALQWPCCPRPRCKMAARARPRAPVAAAPSASRQPAKALPESHRPLPACPPALQHQMSPKPSRCRSPRMHTGSSNATACRTTRPTRSLAAGARQSPLAPAARPLGRGSRAAGAWHPGSALRRATFGRPGIPAGRAECWMGRGAAGPQRTPLKTARCERSSRRLPPLAAAAAPPGAVQVAVGRCRGWPPP